MSPDAKPNNEGGKATRWLTDHDIEVLRTVAQLRAKGLDTDAVNEKLATLSHAVVLQEDDNVVANVETPVDHSIANPKPTGRARRRFNAANGYRYLLLALDRTLLGWRIVASSMVGMGGDR